MCFSEPVVLQFRGAGDFVLQGCKPAVLSHGGVSMRLAGARAPLLEGLGGLVVDDTVPPRTMPDVTGQALSTAARQGRRRGLDVKAAGQLIDPSVPMGTILWQTPLPGTDRDATDAPVGAYVAVARAPRCRSAALSGRYLSPSPTSGSNGETIALGNRSFRPCSLRGTARLVGVDRRGRPVTAALTLRVGAPLVLSPRTDPGDPAPGALYADTGGKGIALVSAAVDPGRRR